MQWQQPGRDGRTAEHVAWFGAGLSLAALAVVGYQLIVASLLPAPLAWPGLQPTPAPTDGFPTRTPFPTHTPYPTNTPLPTRTPVPTRTPLPTPTLVLTRTPLPSRTPVPTHTPYVTRTAYATRTPSPTPPLEPPDTLATAVLANPDAVVDAVATFAARTNAAFDGLQPRATPGDR
jgi:hypothetical protein